MRQLINIEDVREQSQLSKQLNSDAFGSGVVTVQKNQLAELLGIEMFADFFNFLNNDFTNYGGAIVRDSVTQITLTGFDASSWLNYSLRINNSIFVFVTAAVFGGSDTVLTVAGYDLPATITTLDFSTESKYTILLNGETYTNSAGNSVFYYGLRAFLSWYFLSAYLSTGNLKQADVGNINIVGDLFSTAPGRQLKEAKSEFLQNASREQNRIIEYLEEKSTTYPLWVSKSKENIVNFDFMII